MSVKPLYENEPVTIEMLLSQLRFKNGFATGTVAHHESLDSYRGSPEIFLNVPTNTGDSWNINIVDESGGDICPIISCRGTRQLFSISEVQYHHEENSTIMERLEGVIYQTVPTSLAINFSPVAPPDKESGFLEVKYKGLTAKVEWWWDGDNVVVSDFEGKRISVHLEGREILLKEAD